MYKGDVQAHISKIRNRLSLLQEAISSLKGDIEDALQEDEEDHFGGEESPLDEGALYDLGGEAGELEFSLSNFESDLDAFASTYAEEEDEEE